MDEARVAEAPGDWTGTLLARDPELRLVRQVTTDEIAVNENYFKLMQAFVYRRVR